MTWIIVATMVAFAATALSVLGFAAARLEFERGPAHACGAPDGLSKNDVSALGASLDSILVPLASKARRNRHCRSACTSMTTGRARA